MPYPPGGSFRPDRKSGLWTPNRKPPLQSRINWQHPLAENLTACYLMNEGGGNTLYDIASNNTGAFVNNTHWIAGLNDPAIDFDGTNDYINLGNFLGAGISSLTVAIWFKPDILTGRHILINQWGDSGDRVFTLEYGTAGDGKLEFTISKTGAAFFRASEDVGSITASIEYNIVGVYDNSNVLVYADGQLRKLGASVSGNLFNEEVEPIKIGEMSTGGGAYDYNGTFDKAYIWVNRAFSAGEIAQLYREPYCFIESPWPNRGALWEAAVVVGGVVPLVNAGLVNRGLVNGGLVN